MNKILKNRIKLISIIVIIINIAIVNFLFKSRAFSHLAVWNIIESADLNDFYWPPENAPGYFRFEADTEKPGIFKDEIRSLIRNKTDDFGIMLETAKYAISSQNDGNSFAQQSPKGKALKWDSPEGMLRQIRAGVRGAHCFHRAILFSAYLSAAGLKSRLWALENEKFNSTAHTVNEVYIPSLKKWVFVDIMFGFYVTGRGNPLSFLELRARLLNNRAGNILLQKIGAGAWSDNKIPVFYPKLVQCVFLRSRNDFIKKYNSRYGFLSVFQNWIDKLPNGMRIGADYWLGGREKFIHYADKFSKSLKSDIILAKTLFYFLVGTIFFSFVFYIVSFFVF